VQFALVSREIFPFGGGGLGAYVTATAEMLAAAGEVTIFTTDAHREQYEDLLRQQSPLLPREDVHLVFVPEPRPEDVGSFYNLLHLWSARAFDALKRFYAGGGPALVEFPDYLGEGAVTVQAKRTLDPVLAGTRVCIRCYTTYELIAILDGAMPRDRPTRMIFDLERYALGNADALLWPGGDVLGTYQRFYGQSNLPPATRVRHPMLHTRTAKHEPGVERVGDTVRLLYTGRLERRKGVQNLLKAATGLEHPNWRLTLVGGDTDTAPLGTSMRGHLELVAAGDPRIEIRDHVPRQELAAMLADADVCVFPSLWECWPNTVLEAYAANRPVVATPTGGFRELVDESSGWLTRDVSATSLAKTLGQLLDEPEHVNSITAARGPGKQLAALTDVDEARERYVELAQRSTRRQRRRRRPLVSVIVPYFQMEAFVEETLHSIVKQTYSPIETIVVNDGSFRPDDWVLGELAVRYPIRIVTQQNAGLGAARNFGILQSNGRYIFPLDADNLALPTFVERCVEVLEADDSAAYVTSWSDFIDEDGGRLETIGSGYQPIGNEAKALEDENVAGDAAAVIRRRLFDAGFWYSQDAASYEDWLFYRVLASAGHFGRVIPDRLLLYRVRTGSMVRTTGFTRYERLMGELEAGILDKDVRWTP
jgi:glycogen synthase